MKEFIENLIGRLEEYKYTHLIERDSGQSKHCLEQEDCEMMDCTLCVWDKAIEIVNQLAKEQEHCIKSSCSECEVYDKEKHYCPKWCEVIKHTTNELAEEHNNVWIPVSERLPRMEEYQKNNGKFIVTDGNVVFVAHFDIYETQSFGVPLIHGFCTNPCIAWQPLPEHYQPKGE